MKTIPDQIQPLMHVVHDVLGEDILAAYLYGSAVMGGLQPTSDLDVMVVSERPTNAAEKQELVRRLLEISMNPRPLELTIVVQGDVRPWRYPPRRDFQFGEWWRAEYEKGNFEPWTSDTDPDLASLIRMVLFANEVLEGPPPEAIFDPVPRSDYVASLVAGIEGLLDDLEEDARNVVLTLARIWSDLVTNEIRSKDQAAEWVMDRLPADHRSVLAEARALYLGKQDVPTEGFVARARPYADYAVAQINDLASTEQREALARTFDRAAGTYHTARPAYPDKLFDDLVAVTGLQSGDTLLEVGCGTGIATLPLASRDFRITCLEPGHHLAAVARENLATFDVRVIETSFEEWRPKTGETFNLVYAATAWRWVEPSIRYQRAWEALGIGGHLALWDAQHVFPENGDSFFLDIQTVYEEIGEDFPTDVIRPRPGELSDDAVEIQASGLFELIHIRHFDWEVTYDASSYIALLDTFSGHIAMDDWKRDRLYGEIRKRLSARPDGLLRRHWGAVLQIARRHD